ncbi:restriction endonuclease subunit S [Tetragenococcus halophilus]|uniref:restriction endonuclease subunit S n=1 Tax=Tetragenococcus halophilus TaxID=51669 RepID=UPI00215540B5|nr:restriction endonuclease subunit S [Tetragenococcus halophilus]
MALHQEKLSKLQSLKKAALQSLFPQKNETEPKVRFANFTDRWSSYKIKDIFLERVEKNGEGELISVTINSGVVKASELDRKDNSSSNKTNYKRIKRHDIVYNSMRMWQGASGYSPYNGIVSPAYTVITPKPGINSKFFSFMFKKNEMIQNFKRNSQGLTSDTWNLKFPALSSIKVKVPKTEEQDKIEQYMTNLDSIIKLYQIKLENLQGIKKALLQKMFI